MGIVVGVLYGLLKVRSPAPPVVALVGLFGILAGELLVERVRHWYMPAQAQTSEADAREAGDPP